MEITAKTKEGYFIEASEAEVKEIYQAVSRPVNKESPIKIGDKLPAFDYAATINKMKEFKKSWNFSRWKENGLEIAKEMQKLTEAVESLTFETDIN